MCREEKEKRWGEGYECNLVQEQKGNCVHNER